MSTTSYVIEDLQPGDGRAELNERLRTAQTALNELDARIGAAVNRSATIKFSVPVAPGVTAGSLVYYDTANARYDLAQALLAGSVGSQGESVEAPQARVEGIIVAIYNGSSASPTGDMLINGTWTSSSIVNACLGSGAAAGTYYLSPLAAGHATLTPGPNYLKQPVISYHGNGDFSFFSLYMAHDNHYHASAILMKPWQTASAVEEDKSVTAPAGAKFGYPVADDADIVRLGTITADMTAIFSNGVLEVRTTRSIATQAGNYSRYSQADSTGAFAWLCSIDDSSSSGSGSYPVAVFTTVDNPTTASKAYADSRHAGAQLTITAVSGSTITVGGISYARSASLDTPSYAWRGVLGLMRYTWSEYPETGATAYGDTACTTGGTPVTGRTNGYFEISDNILWYKGDEAPASGSVQLFNNFPFSYGHEVVRSVVSDSDILTASTANGITRLDFAGFTQGATIPSASAVASVSGNVLTMTPVLTNAYAGSGIGLTRLSDGSVVISASDLVDSPRDAYSINYNGASLSSDGLLRYITFPAGRSSEIVCTLPVCGNGSETTYNAVVWGMNAGAGASFAVKLYWIKDPGTGESVQLPTSSSAPLLTTSLPVVAASNAVNYAETEASAVISGNGTLVASITAASPSADLRLLRVGFKLTTADVSAETPAAAPSSELAVEATAAEAIAKYSAVYLDAAGQLHACGSSTVSNADKCIGVALSAGTAGSVVRYALSGVVTDASLTTLTPGGALYVGPTGAMTQTSPAATAAAAYIQRIGAALSSGAFVVSISPAVIKG